LGTPVVVALPLANPIDSPIELSVIAEPFCKALLLFRSTGLETIGVSVLVLARAAWTAAAISGCREEIILLISSCWLTVELGSAFVEDLGASLSKEETVLPELGSAFDEDSEASRSEEGTVLTDEPDCVVVDDTLEPVGTESDFTGTIEPNDDNDGPDVEIDLEPVRRDFDLSESDFAETIEFKYVDDVPDVKEIKGFGLITINPSC